MEKETVVSKPLKLNYPKTMLIGTAFLGVSIAFAIFTPYLTIILDRLLGESAMVASWGARFAGIGLLSDFMATQGYDLGGGFTIVPLLIGIIMTFIYVLGMIFQPIFGKMSDNWHSRFGRRRPFIVVLMPLSTIFFVAMTLTSSLFWLIAFMLIFSFLMAAYRVPTVSLMPDLTPSELRSSANAIISLMGGLGTILGMAAGMIINVIFRPEDQFETFPHIFILGAVVMLICTGLMYFVKEQDSRLLDADVLDGKNAAEQRAAEKAAKAEEKAKLKQEKLSKKERKSLMFMLIGLFFLFSGSNVIQTFFALFAAEILHRDVAFATMLMALFAVCAAAGAVPAGALGRKFGRRNTMIAGLAVIMASLAVFFGVFLIASARRGMNMSEYVELNNAYVHVVESTARHNEDLDEASRLTPEQFVQQNPEQFAQLTALSHGILETSADLTPYQALDYIETAVQANIRTFNTLIFPVMVVAGFSSMMIMVNAMPLVVELGGKKRVGTFTGYYYIATYSAQIISPIAYGFFRIFSGSYISLFYYAPVMFVVSALALLFVRHGEARKEANPDDEPLPEDTGDAKTVMA